TRRGRRTRPRPTRGRRRPARAAPAWRPSPGGAARPVPELRGPSASDAPFDSVGAAPAARPVPTHRRLVRTGFAGQGPRRGGKSLAVRTTCLPPPPGPSRSAGADGEAHDQLGAGAGAVAESRDVAAVQLDQ